ncbi:MAG: hypothetical protein KDJ35_02410 [Alphaproteobacteria bacterium]|nr:hypothetical protein [Alphaproteobacteria bacterium]
MNENNDIEPQKPPVGNLVDFVYGVNETNPLHVEVAVDEKGRVVVFHDKPFRCDVNWYEYDVETSKLSFILEEGEIRNLAMTLEPIISKNMQNSHQILTILLDDETGEAKEGNYIPLIIHQS